MGPSAYDVIVVVGGAIGLSAAYQCARAGKKVLLLVWDEQKTIIIHDYS